MRDVSTKLTTTSLGLAILCAAQTAGAAVTATWLERKATVTWGINSTQLNSQVRPIATSDPNWFTASLKNTGASYDYWVTAPLQSGITASGESLLVTAATWQASSNPTLPPIKYARLNAFTFDADAVPSIYVTSDVRFTLNLTVSDTPYAYNLASLLSVTDQVDGRLTSVTSGTPSVSGWTGLEQLAHFVSFNDPEQDGILMPREEPYVLSGRMSYRATDSSGDGLYYAPALATTLTLTPTSILPPSPPSAPDVPVPPALWLLASGLGALGVLRRRR